DFILIDEKNKTYIIYEAKGRNSQTNIDNQIEYKMKAMKYSTFNEITDSQNRYKPKNDNYFFKVSNNKENLEFSNGKDVLTFTNMKKIIKSS
nr:hypothetical protein [Ureaplasma sp.]